MAKLEFARRLAEEIIREMEPFAERVKIAGSIRRRKSEVKDIEIVAIPKLETVLEPSGNLFEPFRELARNQLFNWAISQKRIRWIKPGTSEIIDWQPKESGKYWRGLIEPGKGADPIKLDLFLTVPQNWGVIMTIRTGPANFSEKLVTFIKNRTGYRVQEGSLISDASGEIIPCNEEREFFEKAGIRVVSISEREADDPYRVIKFIN